MALSLASWALSAHHLPTAVEIVIVIMGLSTSVMAAAMIWVLYVALEPYVRRRWPKTIISWTRILGGRFRDPVVGGHILVGILFGVVLTLLVDLLAYLNIRSNGVPDQFVLLSTIHGVMRVASDLLGTLPGSIMSTLGVFFLLFMFVVIFRREWLAASAFVVFLTAIAVVASAGSAVISTPIRLLHYALVMFVMLRFGLLPFVVGSAIVNILMFFPITGDFSAWYAGSAIFALAFVAVFSAWAFHTALGGRPLFKQDLLDG